MTREEAIARAASLLHSDPVLRQYLHDTALEVAYDGDLESFREESELAGETEPPKYTIYYATATATMMDLAAQAALWRGEIHFDLGCTHEPWRNTPYCAEMSCHNYVGKNE